MSQHQHPGFNQNQNPNHNQNHNPSPNTLSHNLDTLSLSRADEQQGYPFVSQAQHAPLPLAGLPENRPNYNNVAHTDLGHLPSSANGRRQSGSKRQPAANEPTRAVGRVGADIQMSGMVTTLPIHPSIPAPSPTYPAGQYSPYAPPPPNLSHNYHHPQDGMYQQPARPDWAAGYAPGPAGPMTSPHQVFPQTPTSMPDQQARPQIFNFIPLPGPGQRKRPRRRYEEIERIYKCGWKGCLKGYGTLNHLNAHVTMQRHGPKRLPDEFKEIRRVWKLKKKEKEDEERRQKEERQRQAEAAGEQNGAGEQAVVTANGAADALQTPVTYANSRSLQLPLPIPYGQPHPGPQYPDNNGWQQF